MSARVLIIDPDVDQLTSLKFALQEEGYSVEIAHDGMEGLERFKELQPNLVITELMMDRLSGFELSSRITSSDEFRAPVFFYTGFYRDERARKEVVLKYGASGYFVKPFQLQALKRALARELGQGNGTGTPAAEMPQKRQASRKRFATAILGETWERNEPAPPTSEERIEKVSEEVAHSNELFPPAEHLDSLPQTTFGAQHSPESDNALAELPMSQEASPSGQDFSATELLGTLSVGEEVPRDTASEPQLLTRESHSREMPAISPYSPAEWSETPLHRSRPFQILVALALLGVTFFLFRGASSLLTKKPSLERHRQPDNVQPTSQASLSQAPSESTNPHGPVGEPAGSGTVLSSADLQAKARGLNSNKPAHASDDDTTPSPLRGLPGEDSHVASTSGTKLVIKDVTGEGGPPYLLKSRRPIVSPDIARTAGTKPLVVRVVIGSEGKVIEATSLNQSDSNASLSSAALVAIQDWEFSSVRGKGERAWTRYFSFRFTDIAE